MRRSSQKTKGIVVNQGVVVANEFLLVIIHLKKISIHDTSGHFQ
jgi:hypothetical protein